jgi:hypothetical protein
MTDYDKFVINVDFWVLLRNGKYCNVDRHRKPLTLQCVIFIFYFGDRVLGYCIFDEPRFVVWLSTRRSRFFNFARFPGEIHTATCFVLMQIAARANGLRQRDFVRNLCVTQPGNQTA